MNNEGKDKKDIVQDSIAQFKKIQELAEAAAKSKLVAEKYPEFNQLLKEELNKYNNTIDNKESVNESKEDKKMNLLMRVKTKLMVKKNLSTKWLKWI